MLPPFGWQAAVTRWEFAPVVTAIVAVIAALYLWGGWRVARRHPARPWPWWRTAFFLGGLLVIVLATESGIGAYDELFWVHMIQHLMLIMIAPPLLVLGQPVTLLLHASRNPLHTWTKRVIRSRAVTILTWPPVGFAAYAATIVATHLTGLTTLVLTNQSVHDAEHALYLVAGYLFFLPIFGREPIRWRISYPVRFMLLVLIMPVDTFTGLVLGSESTPIQGLTTQRPPGSPSPLQDVHWAGAIMWVGGDAIMLGFMMLVFLMWAHSDGIGARINGGWLEAVRTSSFETLVRPAGSGPAAPATSAASAPASEAGPAAGAAAPAQAAAPAAPAPAAAAVRAQAAERASAGTIDDDAHLDAYNAYLARLNQSGHGPAR
jgi:cytochrome c oxidase assembly factor CtaG